MARIGEHREVDVRGHGRWGVLALALALTTATAACSDPRSVSGNARPSPPGPPAGDTSAARPTTSPSPSPLPPPPVTLAGAAKALAGILGADGVLGAATPHLDADRRIMLAQTRDGQEALTAAAFNGSAEALPPYTWGTPELLVPRGQNGPLWFAAIVDRREPSGGVRTAVLTLMRPHGEDWRLSSTSLLDEGTRPPEIAKDADGYATALGEEDTSVAISPRLMAPLHATSAEEGERGFAAGLIEKGPHTTGFADEITKRRRDGKKKCLGYDSIFAASNYPVHALRTADGGALVVYALIRTTTRSAKIDPCASDARIPSDARKLTTERFMREEVRTVETQLYVSTVPAKESGRPARVIGYLGGLTKVSVS
ncbi:hypothetical protein OG884_23545 [Streptosporangium sp. NBC_01755]|uniref:hypothetical protein n=1 Tax=unclassified Streptosporangium TaxID=2632669 RepID=UPI002DD81E77|nr:MULTISPECIES: hypothetical protein [unclassified Streptosporangium]WSA24069.1 hypothetical protein OIE13_24380 [Streptosporangium sp. NBC_01810]WSC97859.1 hypothetical protein OG884_23545 [Streptosporangium sp. NBC_01755]